MPGQQAGMPMQGQQAGMPMPGAMNMGQNTNIENGYKPIVTINAFGNITIDFEKISLFNNHLGFERNQKRSLGVTASCLTDIWRSIVNFEDCIYSEDYFTLIGTVFDKQSQNIKEDIKRLFYNASYFYNGSGEVWNRFSKKIDMLTKTFQNLQTDQNVWYLIVNNVYSLISKNIFY